MGALISAPSTNTKACTILHHRIAQFVLLFWRKVQKSVLVILRCDAVRRNGRIGLHHLHLSLLSMLLLLLLRPCYVM